MWGETEARQAPLTLCSAAVELTRKLGALSVFHFYILHCNFTPALNTCWEIFPPLPQAQLGEQLGSVRAPDGGGAGLQGARHVVMLSARHRGEG